MIHHFTVHFSFYFLLVMMHHLCVLNLFIQKSKFEWFSYSNSKWVIKQQRQLAASTIHLTQESLMNVECSGVSRSFAKEMSAFKMRSVVGNHWKLTTTNRASIATEPLTTTQEVAEGLTVDHATVVEHLKQIGKVKGLGKWCLMSWLEIFKIVILSVIFLHSVQQLWTISQIVICNEKKVLYDN